MPQKQYRHDGKDKNYQTISLTLSPKIIKFLDEKIKTLENKNMSAFIENAGLNFKTDFQERREYGKKPKRKTFTFSTDFIKKIKNTGNMSMAVESAIIKKFNLK